MDWYMETETSAKGVTVCVEPAFEEKHKMPGMMIIDTLCPACSRLDEDGGHLFSF
jgi:hypothetical protein